VDSLKEIESLVPDVTDDCPSKTGPDFPASVDDEPGETSGRTQVGCKPARIDQAVLKRILEDQSPLVLKVGNEPAQSICRVTARIDYPPPLVVLECGIQPVSLGGRCLNVSAKRSEQILLERYFQVGVHFTSR
jgi:hypothetical protein